MTPIRTADDGLATPGKAHVQPRKIVRRTRGNRHGPITKLMSPSDLGQQLKPFVFLDLFDMEHASFQGMGLHPHSGIATITPGLAGPGCTHRGATSSIKAPVSVNHLAVRLRAGESWRYQRGVDHTVGWVSLSTGRLRAPERVEAGELAIFESSTDAIDFHADADSEFVLGSAAPHRHDLVLGQYSVHTSASALRAGEQRLREIQHRLRNEGRL